jgi:hypothetical protein
LESTWKALGKHLESTWKALGKHLESTWKALIFEGRTGTQKHRVSEF